jgi:predicted RNA-binding protein with RPS1 domain
MVQVGTVYIDAKSKNPIQPFWCIRKLPGKGLLHISEIAGASASMDGGNGVGEEIQVKLVEI